LIRNGRSKWKIQVKYSKNARFKLEVKPWGVLVTLPEGADENEACRIIERHRRWIEERHAELLEALERSRNVKLVERSETEFRSLVKKLVDQAAKEVLGVNPCRVAVRRMKSRWASCSPRGTITVNALAKYLPLRLISYIIYHEICHVIETRYNETFWSCVQKHCPNYKELEKELLVYEVKLGFHLHERNA